MNRPNGLGEAASRANDHKEREAEELNRGGQASDGKDMEVAQGGKRRGPGRWTEPGPSRG